MYDKFKLIIHSKHEIRLLSRILILINKVNIKINYINFINQENGNKYIIHLICTYEQLLKISKLIMKLIGIYNIYYYQIKENKRFVII